MKTTHVGYAGYHTAKQTMTNLKSCILIWVWNFPLSKSGSEIAEAEFEGKTRNKDKRRR